MDIKIYEIIKASYKILLEYFIILLLGLFLLYYDIVLLISFFRQPQSIRIIYFIFIIVISVLYYSYCFKIFKNLTKILTDVIKKKIVYINGTIIKSYKVPTWTFMFINGYYLKVDTKDKSIILISIKKINIDKNKKEIKLFYLENSEVLIRYE